MLKIDTKTRPAAPADMPVPDSPVQGLIHPNAAPIRPCIIHPTHIGRSTARQADSAADRQIGDVAANDADTAPGQHAEAAARLRADLPKPSGGGPSRLIVSKSEPAISSSARPVAAFARADDAPAIDTQLGLWVQASAPNEMAGRRAAMNEILRARREARPMLSLCFRELSSLPACLSDLPALRRLDIAGNRLKRLPRLPPGLLELDASRNLLTNGALKLPPHLQRVNLRENDPTALPSLPPTLTHLEAGRNRLAALPESLPPALVFLEAEHNAISRLPATLPPQLREICLEHNRIESIGHLPASVVQADFDDNALTTLPAGGCEGLRHLSVARNRIARVPGPVPSSLGYIDLSGNRLTQVPQALWQLGDRRPAGPGGSEHASEVAKGIERACNAGIAGALTSARADATPAARPEKTPAMGPEGGVSLHHEIHLRDNPLDVAHEQALRDARIAAGHVVPELHFNAGQPVRG